VLVGAGALGSQIGINLAAKASFLDRYRSGYFCCHHNLARHALLIADTGAPKAFALAQQMGALLDETCTAARCDVTNIGPECAEQDIAQFAAAQIIIDASASFRFRAFSPTCLARWAEDCAPSSIPPERRPSCWSRTLTAASRCATWRRSITIFSYRAFPADHLKTDQPGVRYSGSCRALTNRIPATRAALAERARRARNQRRVARRWFHDPDLDDKRKRERSGLPSAMAHLFSACRLGSWSVTYDHDLLRTLRSTVRDAFRTNGRVFCLGIHRRQQAINHVAHAMPQPTDSRGRHHASSVEWWGLSMP